MNLGSYIANSNEKSLTLGTSGENLLCKNPEFRTCALRNSTFMSGEGEMMMIAGSNQDGLRLVIQVRNICRSFSVGLV